MKPIEWIVVICVAILVAILLLLFVWFIETGAQEAEIPQVWLEWANCERIDVSISASAYSIDIPGNQQAYFDLISPGYGAAFYPAQYEGCVSNKCWYGRLWDNFVDGHEWYVQFRLLYGGTYKSNTLVIDCRNKVYLPMVRK